MRKRWDDEEDDMFYNPILHILRTSRQEALINFRKSAKAPVSVDELNKLQKEIYTQHSDLGKEVAEVYFEDECLNQFTLMCNELKEAGYEKLTVASTLSSFTKTELRASPKCHGNPLWTIAKKYFPEATSCGGDSTSDMQGLSISFPVFLLGEYDLLDPRIEEDDNQ